MVSQIIKKSALVCSGNNYQITDVYRHQQTAHGFAFSTCCVNEYGSVWPNEDLWLVRKDELSAEEIQWLVDNSYAIVDDEWAEELQYWEAEREQAAEQFVQELVRKRQHKA